MTLRTLLPVLSPVSAPKAGGTCLPAGDTHLWHANSSLAGDWRPHNQSPHWQTGMLPLRCVRLCLGSRANDPVYLVCNRTPAETAQGRKALLSFHFQRPLWQEMHGTVAAGVGGRGASGLDESRSRDRTRTRFQYHLQGYSQGPTFARWVTVSKVLQLPQIVPPAGDQVFKHMNL